MATEIFGNAYIVTRRFGWSSGGVVLPPVQFGTPITLESDKRFHTLSSYMANAYELFFLWLREQRGGIRINGSIYPTELVFINDESDGAHVEWATKKLVTELGIKLLLGPYSSGLTNRSAYVANQYGATQFCSGAASKFVFDGRPQIFGTSTPANQWLIPALDMFGQLGDPPKTIAYLQEDVGFTKFACSSLPGLAAANNMTIVHSVTVSPGADMSEMLTAVAGIAAHTPDIVVSCNYDTVCKNLVNASKQLSFNPKAFVLTTCVPGFDFIQDLKSDGLYIQGTAAWTYKVSGTSTLTGLTAQNFYDMYLTRFGIPPHYLSAAAFAAASMYVSAIESTNSTDPKKVADAIRVMDVQTEYGRVHFDSDGLCKKKMSIVEWKNFVQASIVDNSNSELPTYPKPNWNDQQCLSSSPGLTVLTIMGFDANGVTCGKCPDGMAAEFQVNVSRRICRNCPIGKVLVTTATALGVVIAECQQCPAGTFWCGQGWYAPPYPSYVATDLRESSYCDVQPNMASFCRDCPPGRYTDAKGFTLCQECAVGKYQNLAGKEDCNNCQDWEKKRYPDAFSAVKGSTTCTPCPQGAICELYMNLRTSYTNHDGHYLVKADPLNYGSELVLGKLYQCPHADGKGCLSHDRCYVDETSGEVSMEGPFCGDCKEGFARGETDELCTKCGSPLRSWALGFVGAVIIFGFTGWLTVSQLLKDPRAMLPGVYVILRQFMNYVHLAVVVVPNAHLSNLATSILEATGSFSYVSATTSPLSAATGTECYLKYMFPDMDIFKVWILAGYLLVPCWLVFDVFMYSAIWALCKWLKTPTPSVRQLILGLALNLYVLQPRLTKLFLIPFDCNYLDELRLMAQTSVVCNEDILGWQIFAVFGLLFYSFGIPMALVGVLYSFRKANQLQSVECAEMFGFLFQGLKPGYYYYEAVLMTRKVLFQIFAYIPWLSPGNEDADTKKALTSLSLLLLEVIFLGIHLRHKPYDFRDFRIFHRVENAMLWALLITSLSEVWLYTSNSAWVFSKDSENQQRNVELRDTIISIVVIVFHLRFFCLVLWGFVGSSIRATKTYQRWIGGDTKVQITKDGMIIESLSMESKIFLADLIHQVSKGTMRHGFFFIDDLDDAIRQIVVETYYQQDIVNFEAQLPFFQRQLRGCWFWLPKSCRRHLKKLASLEEAVMENADDKDFPWRNDPYNFEWDPGHFDQTVGRTFLVEDLLLAYVNVAWRHDGRKAQEFEKRRWLNAGEQPKIKWVPSSLLRQFTARSDINDQPVELNPELPPLLNAVQPNDVSQQSAKPIQIHPLPGVVCNPVDACVQQASHERENLMKQLREKDAELALLRKQQAPKDEDFIHIESTRVDSKQPTLAETAPEESDAEEWA